MSDAAAKKLAERRQHVRYALTGNLPGDLVSPSGERFEIVTVDVSKHGLGLLCDPAPIVGSSVTLVVKGDRGRMLEFEVRWSLDQHDFVNIPGLGEMRRCGLLLKNRQIDLVKYFATIDSLQLEE